MAQRFACGLSCTYPTTNVGRWYCRWLVEWLTQVVGWSLVDASLAGTSNWTNVAASGVNGQSAAPRRIDVISPAYVFSNASVGGYLTITGFAAPYQTRDGVYRIRRFLGLVAPNTYALELDIDLGVHSDGVPAGHAGLSWRLWFGNDSYCPSTNSDWAVVGGQGTTGGGVTTGVGSGDSMTFNPVGNVVTLTCATANFQLTDLAKTVTIYGSTAGNDGTFVITGTNPAAKQISWVNAGGANEPAFTGTWTIRYTYHVHIRAESWNFSFPEIRLAPWASWDSITHAWTVGDLRYTAAVTPGGSTPEAIAQLAIFAEADSDHFSVSLRGLSGNYRNWKLYAVGELNAHYPDVDSRPCYVWAGTDYIWTGDQFTVPIIGFGSYVNATYNSGFRTLARDDLTTVTSYAMLPIVPPSSQVSGFSNTATFISTEKRKLSTRSIGFYKIPIIVECQTSGYMELRGTVRYIWACPPSLPALYAQGASGEYVSVLRGTLIPWNGSRNAVSDVGANVGPG